MLKSLASVLAPVSALLLCMPVFAGCDMLPNPVSPTPVAGGCQSSPLGCPTNAGNDFTSPLNPAIGGTRVSCTDARGQRVSFVPNPGLNDVGRASQSFVGPVIELNPTALAQLPPKLQLFWYGHECAHHVLGHVSFMAPNSESGADCWSISVGRQKGIFTRAEVEAFAPYFQNNPGSPWGHLPGPQRLALLVSCFDQG